MIGSLENLMLKLHIRLIFAVNINFPGATYHKDSAFDRGTLLFKWELRDKQQER